MFKSFGTFRSKHLPANWELWSVLLVALATTPLIVFQSWPEVVMPVAIVVYIVSVPAAFAMWQSWKKWSRKHTPHDRAITVLAVFFAITPLLSFLGLGTLAVWREANRPVFATLAPAVCVNRTSKLGITGPSPEQTSVDVQEISSVGIVCPDALPLTHGFRVKSVWVQTVSDGAYRNVGGYGGDEMLFIQPLTFLPGDKLVVHLNGSEDTYYKQNFELTYVIYRKWGSYASIIRYLSDPQPGFDPVDWARLQSVGFVVQDTGRNINGATDALYGDYYDATTNDQTLFLNFGHCDYLGGKIYDYMKGSVDRDRNRVHIEVPKPGGIILVKGWDSDDILMTCIAAY